MFEFNYKLQATEWCNANAAGDCCVIVLGLKAQYKFCKDLAGWAHGYIFWAA